MARSDTVLVVDDEPPIRRFPRTSLTAAGYHIIEAENAAEAMRLFGAEKPDLVILDLGLPDRNGLELIREMRKTSTVPILVLSARHDERSKVQALDLGADDYVSKPFGMDELMARLRAALRHAFQAQGELPVFISGDLTVDLVRRHVTRNGQETRNSTCCVISSCMPARCRPIASCFARFGDLPTRRNCSIYGSLSAGCDRSSNLTRRAPRIF
jgi:two-component system KDP operon response regulator KdpE